MKIALLSDTHGWLDPALSRWFAGVDMILHAGDVGKRSILTALEEIAPTYAVRGNIDSGAWADELPKERVVKAGDMRIALLHIAGRPKSPHPDALDLIARESPGLLLIGHSHIPVIERRDGVLWVNPGAAGQVGFHHERTAALLHLGASRHIDLITLGKRGK